jgi:hypothetical protein
VRAQQRPRHRRRRPPAVQVGEQLAEAGEHGLERACGALGVTRAPRAGSAAQGRGRAPGVRR